MAVNKVYDVVNVNIKVLVLQIKNITKTKLEKLFKLENKMFLNIIFTLGKVLLLLFYVS